MTIGRNIVERLTVTAANSLTVVHYLRFLNASLDVRAGFVGRIRLKIPVSRLRSEPWHILMENVYVVTGPQRFENFDPDQESYLKSWSTLVRFPQEMSKFLKFPKLPWKLISL